MECVGGSVNLISLSIRLEMTFRKCLYDFLHHFRPIIAIIIINEIISNRNKGGQMVISN